MKKRGPVFEVKRGHNRGTEAGKWYWRERAANGRIADFAQFYASKWNAKRAAMRKAATTANATWRVVSS